MNFPTTFAAIFDENRSNNSPHKFPFLLFLNSGIAVLAKCNRNRSLQLQSEYRGLISSLFSRLGPKTIWDRPSFVFIFIGITFRVFSSCFPSSFGTRGEAKYNVEMRHFDRQKCQYSSWKKNAAIKLRVGFSFRY